MLSANVEVYETIEPGQYPARFEAIEEKVSEKDGGTYWLWTFTAAVGGEKITVTGTSSAKLSNRTKSYKWVSALLGRKPEGTVNFAELVGKPCFLVLGLNEDESFNVVDSVLPRKVETEPPAIPISEALTVSRGSDDVPPF